MVTTKQIQYPLYTEQGIQENTKTLTLIISENTNMYIIHRALVTQLHKKRQGNAHTKTRSEVRGGGKKPWKQKGTGRARVGSIRSPLWNGGGVTFGPKTKEYTKKINKKEKQLALRTLLYNKSKNTTIVDKFCNNLQKPHTKTVLNKILTLNIKKNDKVLIIVLHKNINLYKSLRNLYNIELITADQLNIIALLKANKLIITLDALNKINEVYNA
uniref:Large ribosomal subunit protein uL4c n=1 Tax=Asparagopsis taxiformis TaxID=260499 RepID=A0A1C9CCG3_9FLOR|nr:ribosomal protein L4 [Asparagopsis taxiformis]AOM66081.1 ribosomal protein L4 [Asparagopsis taxiformis]